MSLLVLSIVLVLSIGIVGVSVAGSASVRVAAIESVLLSLYV